MPFGPPVSASRQSLAHLTNVVRFTFEAEGPHMGAGVTVPVVPEKRQKKSRLESGQIVPHRGDRVSSRCLLLRGPMIPPAAGHCAPTKLLGHAWPPARRRIQVAQARADAGASSAYGGSADPDAQAPTAAKCLWDVLRGSFGTIDFGGAEPGPVTWHFSACR